MYRVQTFSASHVTALKPTGSTWFRWRGGSADRNRATPSRYLRKLALNCAFPSLIIFDSL